MTRRINQKIAHKRKLNDQHTAEKEVKKARKAETINTPSSLVVDQLVGVSSLALPALGNLARCGAGGGEDDPPDEIDEFFAGTKMLNCCIHWSGIFTSRMTELSIFWGQLVLVASTVFSRIWRGGGLNWHERLVLPISRLHFISNGNGWAVYPLFLFNQFFSILILSPLIINGS